MSTGHSARKKTRAKALLDIIIKTPDQIAPKKTDLSISRTLFRVNPNKRLRWRSAQVSCKHKHANRKCLSLPTATCLKSRGEIVDGSDQISLDSDSMQASFSEVLSFQNFSRGRTSIFKLRDAGSRSLFNGASSVAENSKENLPKKMRSTWSIFSFNSNFDTLKDDIVICRKHEALNPRELLEQHVESEIHSSSAEFLRNSPSMVKVDEDSEFIFPPIPGSDSAISDWRDHFLYNETELDVPSDKASFDPTDSHSRSYSNSWSWSCSSSSLLQKPRHKSSLKPKNLPPPGMVFVAWLNTRTGNRFTNFPVDAKLKTVIDWLGSPLPIIIQQPDSSGQHCDSNMTIAEALGKMLKSPSQQGLAFFIGPVNSKLAYLMKVCDLCALCAFRKPVDEEKEIRLAWI